MTSHYVSQENDAGYALYELQVALKNVSRFPIERYYGDSATLASAALQATSLAQDLTRLAKEVAALQPQSEAAE